MRRLDLSAAVSVVTGAASGIGRATALALAARGSALAVVDRDAGGLRRCAQAGRALGAAVSEHALDVADADAVAALPEAVVAAHGRATVLVNAAGVMLAGRFEEVSMDEVRWLMDVNVFGVIGLTKAFLPVLLAQPAAQVVNVSSLFGIVAPAGRTAYAASKFAVRGFSESLGHELEGGPVGVTVVCPGGVKTAIWRTARVAAAGDADALRERARQFERRFLKTRPEVVGEAIADAVERRRRRLLVGTNARAGALLQRLLPVGYGRVLRRRLDRLDD